MSAICTGVSGNFEGSLKGFLVIFLAGMERKDFLGDEIDAGTGKL